MNRIEKQHRNPLRRLILVALALSLGIANVRADDRPARIREATTRAAQAIVSIRPEGIALAPPGPAFAPPFARWGRPPFRIPGPVIEEPRFSGSGVIVDAERGLVLTSASVLRGAAVVQIILSDGAVRPSRRVAFNEEFALIEFDPQGAELVQAEWGDSESLRLGDDVLAVGRSERGDLLVSAGIVAAERRKDDAESGSAPILTDALAAAETAGGPLLDLNGRVVGIRQLESPPWIGGPRAGFQSAAPAGRARAAVEALGSSGPRPRGYLGVILGGVVRGPGRPIEQIEGAVVTGVAPGSPAAEAGIEPGDRILSVNGQPVADARSLSKAVEEIPVGSELTLRIDRRGSEIEIRVRTRAEIPQPAFPSSRPPIRSEPELKPGDQTGEPSEVKARPAEPSDSTPTTSGESPPNDAD